MPSNSFNTEFTTNKNNLTKISFILSKLLFTIVLGVLFFSYEIPIIGETNTTILNNKLNQLKNKKPQQIAPHYSAQITREGTGNQIETTYTTICNNNILFCNLITTDTTGNDTILQDYKIASIITIVKINNILATPYTLSQSLHNIILKKDDTNNRGYANHNHIVLNVNKLSYKEYMQVLTHELGHIVDLGGIRGESQIKDPSFTEFKQKVFSIDDVSLLFYALSRDSEDKRKKTAEKQDFCSIYGMSNPFEDFAECFNLYLNHNKYFNSIKKSSPTLDQKYTIIATLFNNENITQTHTLQIEKDITERVRDTTKL